MIVGGYGPLIFGVRLGGGIMMESLDKTSKLRFVDHEIMLSKPIVEFTGYDSDEVSFSMLFVEGWTDPPSAALPLLDQLALVPFPYPLIVGGLPVGSFMSMFIITEIGERYKRVNGAGILSVASVKVTLREYSIGIGSTAQSFLSLAGL